MKHHTSSVKRGVLLILLIIGDLPKECATPRKILNATLQTYTGCSASYGCKFGYSSPASRDSNVITCQEDETWTPSDFECVQIPCPSPPSLTNGHSVVTSLNVGGAASYVCDTNFVNITSGGGETTLKCVQGGTWTGIIDMVCIPAYRDYTITITTGSESSSGTDANVYIRLICELEDFTINCPSSSSFESGSVDVCQVTF
ncbi:sushi, von Willebrand factor type A, EGF and pentraxin domain-containing protein 1-like [Mizuhopecten yessoensis]|uniref:sushi, von Willebrand factor type A, EGF and pentraxin domain-containing protein 1-like n=1 Tax=Mizuhopecten yessoensis TaxID=6573 RepID=UPI000B45EB77|nr:sushi, von Willebrand factor type A, EGF and pentraxin domain-containing protein 1-like [Mizuhopecten yessoensis]